MALVTGVATLVTATTNPEKVQETMKDFMNYVFPETAKSKEEAIAARMKELKSFTDQTLELRPGEHGAMRLQMTKKAKQ